MILKLDNGLSKISDGYSGRLDTYDEARRKLSNAEFTSDLQSQAEDEAIAKRYSQRKKRYLTVY